MQIPILLDRSRGEPLTAQLVEQLRDAIRHSRIAPGTRLPSSRQLADQLGVSRNTIVRAYDTLIIEGHVESRPASGIYVCEALSPPPLRSASAPDGATHSMPMPAMPRPRHATEPQRGRLTIDFSPGRTDASLFPVKTWRRLLQSSLARGGAAGLSQRGDPAGLVALRSAVAAHLATTRGIVADPSRVFILGGAQEGVSLVARLFLNHGSLCAIEDPCRAEAMAVLEATGSDVVSVPVDFEGLIAEDLPRRPTALLYLTPMHQFPTGHALSAARRKSIVDWAQRCGCYIVEDDRDGDFCYEGSPLPALAASAPHCTIYLGTFSRTLGAGLRLGYAVVPEQLAEAFGAAKALLNGGTGWLEQAALAEMMRTNSYASHLLRLRMHYKSARDTLLNALRRNFGEVNVTGEAGGVHVMWYLPAGVPDVPIVEAIARRGRIGIYSMASGGAHVTRLSTLSQRGLMLGYGGLSLKQIEQGIARLSDMIDDAIDDHKVAVDKLLSRAALPLAALANPAARTGRLDSRFRRRPALPSIGRGGASLARQRTVSGTPMISVATLFRYPVKGLSAEPLSSVKLAANAPFPGDRVFALARPGAPIDPENPQWAKKGLFAMLMLDEGLARVRTQFDHDTRRLTVLQGNNQIASGRLSDPDEREALEKFFWQLLPTFAAPPALLHSHGGHFMDKPDNVISLINLATVRRLEQQWGYDIDPLRFRANIYIDGAMPWEEFDWVGSTIRIGEIEFSVDRKNGRCGATNVNPKTGRRDLDIPGSLRSAFGHKNLGVYLIAREQGQIAVGDPVLAPRTVRPSATAAAAPALNGGGSGRRRFICRGCYFIYEEAAGLPAQSIPPHTAFADIPPGWRCPDCGTDKGTFRPYV